MSNPTCRHCGTQARHSDRTACCASCKRLFKGLAAFDRHWTTPGPGERVCVDPLTVETATGAPVYETTPVPGGIAYRIRGNPDHWNTESERYRNPRTLDDLANSLILDALGGPA